MSIDVYLESGAKRVFASAVAWPGWSRAGKDEASALEALVNYAPRYERVVRLAKLKLPPLSGIKDLKVVARLEGGATTDFGAPGAIPPADSAPVDDAELSRLQALLDACWRALDDAAAAAAGKELRKGPRGGGRETEEILAHVRGAEGGYLSAIGFKIEKDAQEDLEAIREAIRNAVTQAPRYGAPERGPRGGARWPLRYFVRREAWHVLDHAWEIEDRMSTPNV